VRHLRDFLHPVWRDAFKDDKYSDKTELNQAVLTVFFFVNFTVTKKKTVRTEAVPDQARPTRKVSASQIYSKLIEENLLERFKQSGESTEELLNRIKSDFKNHQEEHWTLKLEEFGVVFE